jgi:hypothetical protein
MISIQAALLSFFSIIQKAKVTFQQVCAIYFAGFKKMIQKCENPITEGDFYCIFTCNCEGTEQFQGKEKRQRNTWGWQISGMKKQKSCGMIEMSAFRVP